jgi:hypothetical protein
LAVRTAAARSIARHDYDRCLDGGIRRSFLDAVWYRLAKKIVVLRRRVVLRTRFPISILSVLMRTVEMLLLLHLSHLELLRM